MILFMFFLIYDFLFFHLFLCFLMIFFYDSLKMIFKMKFYDIFMKIYDF